jgi:hypothetical protein
MQVELDLRAELETFTGTLEYHRWSAIHPQFFLTDGALYLAEKARCYWLMDLIGSYQRKLLRAGETFQVWRLAVSPDRSFTVTCDDGNGKALLQQKSGCTDFPLSEITLYAAFENDSLVILLPGEY